MIWTNSPAKSREAERWIPAQPSLIFNPFSAVFPSASLSSQFAYLQLPPFDEACRTAEFSLKVCIEEEAGSVVAPLPARFRAVFTVCLPQMQPVLHPGLRCAVLCTCSLCNIARNVSPGIGLEKRTSPLLPRHGKGRNPYNYCSVHLDV